MSNPSAVTHNSEGGHFRIFARPPGMQMRDITFFRGAPTQITQMTTTDPFGDATASLEFPSITALDRTGAGDLDWLVPWTDIDIVFYDEDGIPTNWVWEGMFVSEELGESYSIALKGALYQADNFLAAPWYPQYPIPYELLIKSALDPAKLTSLRTAPLTIQFPDDWQTVVPSFRQPNYLWFLRPWGVTPGQKWTGLTTRNTGGWEPMLTGYVQSLLGVMYTEDGQWTIVKETGRKPILKVRPALRYPTEETLVVQYGVPGVKISVTRDFTQSTNVVYGQGSDLNGTEFSGQQVSSDGQRTYYDPFASMPQVYPSGSSNPRFNSNLVRKEARLQLPQGIDEISGRDIAAGHLRRFADPGYIGSAELKTDPMQGGRPFNRQLVRAGMTLLVQGLRGSDILFHITETTVNPKTGDCSLTLDTKFRDALTVAEVKARTRDALDPVRLIRVGQFSTTVQDSIKPWSYAQGSGVVPSGGGYDATELFTKLMPPMERFPWTDTVKKYPPKKYPGYYIKIGPKNANATKNWSGITRNGIAAAAIPVKMSQSGTIRLTQFAAYDADGNVLPVRFHVSFYGNSGVSVLDMPMIPTIAEGHGGYPASQRYPFFKGAFERMKDDGTEQNNPGQLLPLGADLIVGWGNFYEPAGYSPGRAALSSPKTGLMSSETPWPFDTSNVPGFDKYSATNTQKNPTAGVIYVMVYCDDQLTQPVYFLGRLYRQEAA